MGKKKGSRPRGRSDIDLKLLQAELSPDPDGTATIRRRKVVLPDQTAMEHQLPSRYEVETVLGLGGMGVVLLCRDRQIGRRVAAKIIHQDDSADAAQRHRRFVREARIQGQLEHPALVPVYDIGKNPDGTAYFTMKRIRGITLREIIRAGAGSGKEDSTEQYSRRRLLTAFSNVCLAVDYSHQHGVVHRDLKPANIMLGDYGEVYVLDWGIAKLLAEQEDVPCPTKIEKLLEHVDVQQTSVRTQTGELLGTLGYMAPEQLRGGPAAARPAVDIYALGSVLFELLTLIRLHDGETLEARLYSTLNGADARPSVRAPHRSIPPELEAICVKATAFEPQQRYHTVRELHEDLERYLDGQRNEELRRQVASQHAVAATEAVIRSGRRGGVSTGEIRQAMHHLGQALALDPDNEQALETLIKLLTNPPEEIPGEVAQQLEQSRRAHWRWTGRVGGVAYLTFLLYIPLLFWSGVREPVGVVLFVGLCLASALAALGISIMRRPRPNIMLALMTLTTLLFTSIAMFFGPLVLMPAGLASNTAGWAITLDGIHRKIAIAIGSFALGIPVLLQVSGVWPSSYHFSEAGMLVVPSVIDLPAAPSLVLLTIAGLATIMTSSLSVTHIRDSLITTESQLHLQNWQIRQLAPAAPRSESLR